MAKLSTDVLGELVAAHRLTDWLAWRRTDEPTTERPVQASPRTEAAAGRHRRPAAGQHRRPQS